MPFLPFGKCKFKVSYSELLHLLLREDQFYFIEEATGFGALDVLEVFWKERD